MFLAGVVNDASPDLRRGQSILTCALHATVPPSGCSSWVRVRYIQAGGQPNLSDWNLWARLILERQALGWNPATEKRAPVVMMMVVYPVVALGPVKQCRLFLPRSSERIASDLSFKVVFKDATRSSSRDKHTITRRGGGYCRKCKHT